MNTTLFNPTERLKSIAPQINDFSKERTTNTQKNSRETLIAILSTGIQAITTYTLTNCLTDFFARHFFTLNREVPNSSVLSDPLIQFNLLAHIGADMALGMTKIERASDRIANAWNKGNFIQTAVCESMKVLARSLILTIPLTVGLAYLEKPMCVFSFNLEVSRSVTENCDIDHCNLTDLADLSNRVRASLADAFDCRVTTLATKISLLAGSLGFAVNLIHLSLATATKIYRGNAQKTN